MALIALVSQKCSYKCFPTVPQMVTSECLPTVLRCYDDHETQLSFAMKSAEGFPFCCAHISGFVGSHAPLNGQGPPNDDPSLAQRNMFVLYQ